MKKNYKGIYVCVKTPIFRCFEFDKSKHSGLFKYCEFKNSVFKKDMWFVRKIREK